MSVSLSEYLAGLPRGERKRFAQSLGIRLTYLCQLSAVARGVEPSPALAAEIEVQTNGLVPCEKSRKSELWTRIPDSQWMWHPGGRPVIDIGRQWLKSSSQQADHGAG